MLNDFKYDEIEKHEIHFFSLPKRVDIMPEEPRRWIEDTWIVSDLSEFLNAINTIYNFIIAALIKMRNDQLIMEETEGWAHGNDFYQFEEIYENINLYVTKDNLLNVKSIKFESPAEINLEGAGDLIRALGSFLSPNGRLERIKKLIDLQKTSPDHPLLEQEERILMVKLTRKLLKEKRKLEKLYKKYGMGFAVP